MPTDLPPVIRAIEEIVSDDFCEDIEHDLMVRRLLTKREETMAEKLGEIYKLAHAYSEHCEDTHDEWRLKI